MRARDGWRGALLLAAGAAVLASALPARAVPMRVAHLEDASDGFNDPRLGAARRAALEHAVAQWATRLAGEVEVVVVARMIPLGGDERSAVLASAGSTSVHRNFAGGVPSSWYAAALANQLAGSDLNGADVAEIAITFNADVDGPVLGATSWYYGLDAQPGPDVDFVTIALHELGHGLGFFDLVDPATGGPLLAENRDIFGVFERFLLRPGVDRFLGMRDAERLAAITSGQLVWDGRHVLEALRGPAAVYAPAPYLGGSSLSHWDVTAQPDELMEPFYTAAIHDPGLLLPALLDLGWQPSGPTPTPRSTAPIAVTPTPLPTATATPTGLTQRRRTLAFVSNFDDRSVTVLDATAHTALRTITVGDGPLGVSPGPDGRQVFVTLFYAGALAVLDAQHMRLQALIAVGDSAHSVAVSPDGRRAFVTDTFAGLLHVVDLAERRLVDSFPVGMQPGNIALAADGQRLVIALYGGPLVLVDPDVRGVVALLDVQTPGRFGPLGLALTTDRQAGALTFQSGHLSGLDLRRLFSVPLSFATGFGTPEAAVFSADGRTLFVAAHDENGGRVLRITGEVIAHRIGVGSVPEALAIRADGAFLYVANTGSDSVAVVDTQRNVTIKQIPVGRAPMGVALVEVPAAICAGDCRDRGLVDIADLMQAVAIGLEQAPVSTCRPADVDGFGAVSVDEILLAIRHALSGCP